jgi:TetR/AcrR family transcriptional regulator, transcriptional repressor for nem operon
MPRVSDMKERLTDAALDLMWENSYGTTSVDSICERAGAKKGSFYYFFKSKSELTVAALEAEWNKNKANMDALFSPATPPLERFDRYFDYVHDRLAELQEKCGSILDALSLASGVKSAHRTRACALPSTASGIER